MAQNLIDWPFSYWDCVTNGNGAGTKHEPQLHKSFLSIGQLYNLPKEPITWVVDQLFRVKGFTMLYGFSGDGKSAFERYLMASIVQGTNFLGFKVAKPGPVLYFCAEDMVEDLEIYFKGLGLAAGDPLYTFPDTAFDLLSPDVVERIAFLDRQLNAMNGNMAAAFIDTYWDLTPIPNVNDYVAKWSLMLIKSLARKYNVQIFGSHHSIKNVSDPRMAFQGNASIMGCFDTGLYIDRGSKTTTLELTKHRSPFPKPFDKVNLLFDPETYRFSIAGVATQEASDKDAAPKARMMKYVEEKPYAKYKDVLGSSGISAATAKMLLEFLSTIAPVQLVRYGDPSHGYCYVRPEDEAKRPPTTTPAHVFTEWLMKHEAHEQDLSE